MIKHAKKIGTKLYESLGVGGLALFGVIHMKGGHPAPYFSNYLEHVAFPHGITAQLISKKMVI